VTSLTSTSILSGIGPYGTVTPVYTAQQTFTSEGAVGFVVAYALFDDGHYMDVTSNVSVSSLSTSVGITYDASGALLTVRPGAVSLCGEVVEATWRTSAGNISGFGAVVLKMPQATSATLSFSPLVIASNSSLSIFAPFLEPLLSVAQITVFYSDGSQKSFSSPYDPRAVLEVVSGKSLVYTQGATVSARSSGATGAATIRVTFPGLYNISALGRVNVVDFSTVSLSTSQYPIVSSGGSQYLIRPLSCSGTYERVSLKAVGYLSSGVSQGITQYVTLVSSDSNMISVFGTGSSRLVLAGIKSGFTNVTVLYHGFKVNL